jgi:phenylalanyl-tRNA synthetase beta chain
LVQSGPVVDAREWDVLDDERERLPRLPRCVAGALVGDDAQHLFRTAKGLVGAFKRNCHIEKLSFVPSTNVAWADRGAQLGLAVDDRVIGGLGVLSGRARRLAGIRSERVVLFEIEVSALEPLPSRNNSYVAVPQFPEIEIDLSLVFADGVPWKDIYSRAEAADVLVRAVSFTEEYRGKGIEDGKRSITMRVRLGADDRTLKAEEARAAVDRIRSALRVLGAEERQF